MTGHHRRRCLGHRGRGTANAVAPRRAAPTVHVRAPGKRLDCQNMLMCGLIICECLSGP